MKSILALLLCLVLSANCALYFKVQDEVPGHENQCFDEQTNQFYKADQKMPSEPGTCSRVICLGSHEPSKVVVQTATCGAMMPMPPGCKLVQDLSLPYPECCPRIASCHELNGGVSASV